MKTYKIGILGCGKVAHLHAKAILEIPDAEFVAVWSRTEETAETQWANGRQLPYGVRSF